MNEELMEAHAILKFLRINADEFGMVILRGRLESRGLAKMAFDYITDRGQYTMSPITRDKLHRDTVITSRKSYL